MPESMHESIDMSPEARLERTQNVMARMAAGETIDPLEVNPKTHAPELVTMLGQAAKRGGGIEI